jgi:serine/threonine protein kinase
MNHSSLHFEEGLFYGALALPPEERSAFIRRACHDDSELCARVEALLRGHEQENGALDGASPGERAGAVQALGAPGRARIESLSHVGPYVLKRKLGEGGFGVVWLAEQTQPVRRQVALKIVRPGMDTHEVVARFAVERQALALMDHPHIARVFDGGTTENGRPYFVMELVPGIPITRYCDEHRLSTPARLQLFMQVCRAVQHAHQKGVIHRDLKPSNILVNEQEGMAVPKVIDFGIAKAISGRLTDATITTATSCLMGTPAYMSPEQLERGGTDIDTRSDIYNLGVLLYELLTGQTPFDPRDLTARGIDHLRHVIREQEPMKPSTRVSTLDLQLRAQLVRERSTEFSRLQSALRGDIDWIVMCCLEKERARRYDTAAALARDIERHLGNEPVTARPPTLGYLLRKGVRRHRVAFAAGGAVVASMVVALVANAAETRRATSAEQAAVAEREQAERARAEAEAHKQAAERESARSRQSERFLRNLVSGIGPQVARGRDTALLLSLLEDEIRALRGSTGLHPEVLADYLEVLAISYSGIGRHATAVALLREALALHEQVGGPESRSVATLLHRIGVVTEARKVSYDAEPWLRRAYAMRIRLLGPNHPDTIETKAELGRVLVGSSPEESERLLREAIADRRAHAKAPDATLARWLASAAYSVRRPDRGHVATRDAREAVEIYRELFGEESPEVAEADVSLAWALTIGEKFQEAETQARRAAERVRQFLGEAHPTYAELQRILGRTLAGQKRMTEAEAAYRESLTLAHRYNHPGEAGQAIQGLNQILKASGRHDEAERMTREQVAFSRRDLDEHPLMVARDLAGLAVIQLELGRLAEAEASARESLALRDRDDTDTRGWLKESARRLLGEAIARQGRMAEAEPLLLRSYHNLIEVERRYPGKTDNYRALSIAALVRLYRDWNRPAQAQEWKRTGLDFAASVKANHSARWLGQFVGELEQLVPAVEQ